MPVSRPSFHRRWHQDIRELGAAPIIYDRARLRKIPDLAIQGTNKGRIDFLKYRKNLVTDAVAFIVRLEVAAVVTERNTVGQDVAFDLLSGKIQ